METNTQSFDIKDCALVALATGKKAQNLKELRENLLTIHPESIYYHFWGARLRHRFEVPEYNNDFAAWAHEGLRDSRLAECLSVIDPKEFEGLEALRQELIDVIEERLDQTEHVPWSKTDNQFYFIRSQIVIFDTHKKIEDPSELVSLVPHMSLGSIFYHFIDARRRTPDGKDDFCTWLDGLGETYKELSLKIDCIDPYFDIMTDLRKEIAFVIADFFEKKHASTS